MKAEIKRYFENLNPRQLGLKEKIKVKSISKIGMGKNNSNFLVVVGSKKFVFRLNMLPLSRDKTKTEFNSLKLVEKLNIGPKAWILDESRKILDSDFMILDYIEGKTLGKMNYKLDKKLIKKIVRLCVGFHLIPIRREIAKLPKDEVDYKVVFKWIEHFYSSIKNMTKHKAFLEMVSESCDVLRKSSLQKDKHPIVLAHGDICEQNVIVHNGKLKLVDFESLGLTDPASEIAYILTQFTRGGFTEKQKEIFIEEYLKVRNDKTLRKRLKIFVPLKNFADLVWAINHVFKIKNKRLHRYYLENNKLNKDISYAKKMFKKNLREGIVNKKYKNLDLGEVLNEKRV